MVYSVACLFLRTKYVGKYQDIGETAEYLAEGQTQKVSKSFGKLAVLGILAGVYIGLGSQLYTSVMAYQPEGFPLGVLKLISAVAFSLGLILVYFVGAELFTGNCLMPMGWLSGKFGLKAMLRSWAIVYVFNLVGSVGLALLVLGTGLW